MNVLVIRTIQEFREWRKTIVDKSVGFVPTMGALHLGHAELIERAKKENQIVVLSIFVNPTQFNDKKDFEKYPATWESDLKLAEKLGVDCILHPEFKEIYPDNYRFKVSENELSLKLCGHDRPGHFDGVLTIVMKLLNIVRPNRSYFGEKDFQQLSLVRDMVQSFFMETEIVPVQTVREADGLAMSSRNTRLNSEQRQLAPKIYETLTSTASAQEARQTLEQKLGLKVDYVEDLNGRRFAAVKCGEVRLIDNVELN